MSWWKELNSSTITNKIYGHLRALYEPPQWIWYGEFKAGVGYSKESMSYFDAMAINTWGKKQQIVGYEIKASRQDFTKELKNHDKRANIERICNEVWFVVPSGLVKEDEIPEGWGLRELMSNGKFKRIKYPRYHEVTWDWKTILSMAKRSIDDSHSNHNKAFWKYNGQEIDQEALEKLVENKYKSIIENYIKISDREVINSYKNSKEHQELLDFVSIVIKKCNINRYGSYGSMGRRDIVKQFEDWYEKAIPSALPLKFEHAIDNVLTQLKKISDDAKNERCTRARSERESLQPVYEEQELS